MNEQENAVKFNSLPQQQQYAIAVAATQELPFAESVGAANTAVTLDGQPTAPVVAPASPVPNGSVNSCCRRIELRTMNGLGPVEEESRRVEDGAVFHCRLLTPSDPKDKLRQSAGGGAYVYLRVELSNGWNLVHTRFLSRNARDEKQIAVEALKYLQKFGYNSATQTFDDRPYLAEIGSWTDSENKKHYTVKKLFLDERDREQYYSFIAQKAAERAAREAAQPKVELPEV